MIRLNRLSTAAMLMRLSAPAVGGSDSLRSRLQAGSTGLVFFTGLGLDGVEQAATAAFAEVSDVGDHGRHGDAGPGVGVLHRVIDFHGWSSGLVQGCFVLRLSSHRQVVLDS